MTNNRDVKVSLNINSSVTVKVILAFFVYCCVDYGRWVFQSLGCNSRICSCCGKRHADSWAVALSKRMFKVPHRHIVILHTYGKSMNAQPHLHLIMTEGGFNSRNEFIPKVYIHADGFAECWKHHVCTNLCHAGVPNRLTNWCFWNKRFYVWVHKDGRIKHPNLIAKYLGRYVRHPVIANSRIDWFDKDRKLVGFHYDDHNKVRRDVVMTTDEFITALIRHIPPPQFRMIRYYGAYARNTKKKFKKHLQSSIEQTKLMKYGVELPERIFKCPFCGGELEFVCYEKKPPPEPPKNQRELPDWIS